MLTNRYPHVFSPIQIGPVRLKNRLGFAPMVCNKCTVDGTVTDSMVEFVYQQASTGVGYVTIGDTQVDDDLGGAFMATLNIARKTSIPGMIKLTEAAGFGGTVLSVELNHSGRGAKDDLTNGQPIGPSAVCFPRCSQNVRPMERADLERVKGLFVHCAKQCVRAGFRMLMVHCAHNNLLGQFLSPCPICAPTSTAAARKTAAAIPWRCSPQCARRWGRTWPLRCGCPPRRHPRRPAVRRVPGFHGAGPAILRSHPRIPGASSTTTRASTPCPPTCGPGCSTWTGPGR